MQQNAETQDRDRPRPRSSEKSLQVEPELVIYFRECEMIFKICFLLSVVSVTPLFDAGDICEIPDRLCQDAQSTFSKKGSSLHQSSDHHDKPSPHRNLQSWINAVSSVFEQGSDKSGPAQLRDQLKVFDSLLELVGGRANNQQKSVETPIQGGPASSTALRSPLERVASSFVDNVAEGVIPLPQTDLVRQVCETQFPIVSYRALNWENFLGRCRT